MISHLDHLHTQTRLLYDADLKRVWPKVLETAGKPRLHMLYKVLQCERLSGAQIKQRYQWPTDAPVHIKALKDMDRYISVLVLLTKNYTGREHGCVKGIFDLCGGAVVLLCGQVWSPASLQAMHFWHLHARETRWTCRKDMMDDFAGRIRAVRDAYAEWLRKKGFADEPIGLTRTKELLKGLEAGVGGRELYLLLGRFESTMLGYEDNVSAFEEDGTLPPEFTERTCDLMKRLKWVS